MKKILIKPIIQGGEVKKPAAHGKWVYKPLISVVIICVCGNKYVSTRPKQKTCIRCIQDR